MEKLMWVIGMEPIEAIDFETADERGEHWRIRITDTMVRKRVPVNVPSDSFILGLIEQGKLQEIDPQLVARRKITDKNIHYFMQKLSYANVAETTGSPRPLLGVRGRNKVVIFPFVKMGFVCEPAKDYFAQPILDYLKDHIKIKRCYDLEEAAIDKICNWADIVWVEWAHIAAEIVLKKKRRCQVMVRFHRYELKYANNLNWDHCDYVWFVNRDVMQAFARKFLQLKPKIFFLPNAVDTDAIEFIPLHAGKRLLAYSPHFTPLKNYMFAIRLLEQLNSNAEGFTLVIKADPNGNDDYFQECKSYVIKNKLAVKFITEPVTLHDIKSKYTANLLLKEADFILSVSNYECFHYAFAEGLAAGCFGLCRQDREGRPQDFWEPFLCEGIKEMAEQIKALIKCSDEEKQIIAGQNRQYIIDNFSPDKIGKGLINYLYPNPETPRVGVIIPTYNHAHFLKGALASLLTGNYRNVFILVIDDGSTDSTGELLESYRDRIFYLMNDHVGSHPQRELGLKIMKELGVDYVSFPCADDIYYEDYLSGMVAEAMAKDALVVYPRFDYFDEQSQKTTKTFPYYPHNKRVLLTERCYICDHCLVSAEVFDRLGWKLNWQEYGAYCFYDLWVQLTENDEWDKRIVGLDQVLWAYRRYPESLSVTKSDGRPDDLKQKVLKAHGRRLKLQKNTNDKLPIIADNKTTKFKQQPQLDSDITEEEEYEEFAVGGSKHKLVKIQKKWQVIEIGGGANPCPRANVVTNWNSEYHQCGKKIKIPKGAKLFECDVQDMRQFSDKEFDYCLCCHVLEHVNDPARACSEIMRIARRGYIECPSAIAELLLGHDFHQWVAIVKRNKLIFRRKRPEERDRYGDFFKDLFYKDNPFREQFVEKWFEYWKYGYVGLEWINEFGVEVKE